MTSPHLPHPVPHAAARPKHPHAGHHPAAPPGRPTLRTRMARAVGRNWARVGYAYHIEPTWLEVNRFDLAVRDLHPAFDGVKVAHLTDFHCGSQVPQEYLEGALARAGAEKPDLIALTGDFIHKGYKHVPDVGKLLRHVKAPLGVYAVLGNHDFSVRNALGIRRHPGLHQAVADVLGSAGVRVLRNETVHLAREGGGLLVAGVDDLWSRESDPHATLSGRCDRTPRVILAHNPQSVREFGDHRFDLVLSGHTHGGQINWPGLGRVLLGKKARRWAAGLYTHLDGHLYVNKGVGFGWRFRFGVRPEVAVFTLKSK